jgi:uncharacterized membrane protein
MINAFYDFLARMGYTHPFHPTEVHMPIGLVVGAFILALVAVIFRVQRLHFTPRHCIILAFIWVFPTILLGIMDWQHFYEGAWIFPIKMKLITAPILTALLGLSIYLGQRYGPVSLKVLPIYFLCLCAVTVLGYFGGQLTFGGRTIVGPPLYKAGEKMYAAYCTTCHPSGGNTINPSKPVLHSPLLQNMNFFTMWLHSPAAPMPSFPTSKLSDAQIKELYAYIENVLNK